MVAHLLSAVGNLSNPLLLDIAARSVLILLVALAASVLLRRASASARHLVWLTGLVGLLLLPVATAVLPAWRYLPGWTQPTPATVEEMWSAAPALRRSESTAASTAAERSITPPAEPAEATLPRGPASWVISLWAVGVLVALVPPVLGRRLLRRMERQCKAIDDPTRVGMLERARRAVGLNRSVRLLQGGPGVMPMAWGIISPRVILPREAKGWEDDRLRVVLLHELAHIKRWDCLTHLLAQVACAVYWFNPLAWLALRRLEAERECACDDLVLAAGTRGTEYARQLVEVTAGLQAGPLAMAALAMARPSSLEQRVRLVLDSRSCHCAMSRVHVLSAAVLLLAVLAPLAALRARAAVAESDPAPAASPATAAEKPAERAEKAPPTTAPWNPFAQARARARQTACMNNLKQLGLGMIMYAADHNDTLPPDLGATFPYIKAGQVFVCPLETKKVPQKVTPEWIVANTSYVYLGAGVNMADVRKPSETVLAHEKLDAGHDGLIGVAFFDGHVEMAKSDRAEALIKLSQKTLDAIRAKASK